MPVFSGWMEAMGRPEVRMVGMDFPLHDSPSAYRAAVEHIRREPMALGALVTSHKLNVIRAAGDLFDELDPHARLLEEVSCISKRDGRLVGQALDPITSRMAMADFPEAPEALILGAGGAGTAIALSCQARRMHVVDRSQERLAALRRVVGHRAVETYRHTRPEQNDELMRRLAAGSLVINATGMGKDLPGSPVTDAGRFPEGGIAWELNYRGEREFLRQARAQSRVRAVDGWVYFLHGWTQVIAEVLHTPIEGALFERMAEIAARLTNRAE